MMNSDEIKLEQLKSNYFEFCPVRSFSFTRTDNEITRRPTSGDGCARVDHCVLSTRTKKLCTVKTVGAYLKTPVYGHFSGSVKIISDKCQTRTSRNNSNV